MGYQSLTADFQTKLTAQLDSVLFGDPLQFGHQYTFTMHFDDGSTYTKNVSSALSTSASNYANVGTLSIYNYSSAWTSVANAMVRRESLDSANLYDSIYRTNGGLGMIVIHLPGEYRYKRMTYISGYNSGDILAISGVLIPENPVFNTPPQELNTFEFSTGDRPQPHCNGQTCFRVQAQSTEQALKNTSLRFHRIPILPLCCQAILSCCVPMEMKQTGEQEIKVPKPIRTT
jgi:hypothetical protein